MENQGNLQAAVMDLLRSDTLDWEQYPIIYNNLYLDVDDWSPEEVNLIFLRSFVILRISDRQLPGCHLQIGEGLSSSCIGGNFTSF
jgi:hypothetical protein